MASEKGKQIETAPMTNDAKTDIRFFELYMLLVSAMTEVGKIDVPKIESLLCEIASMFRLSKGVTRLYRNPQEESEGGGETLCAYDTGKEGEVVSFIRVVTSVMSIATFTVYMSPDEKPLTEDEKWKVELVMRTTLSFVSRNRLRDLVEELAYFDEEYDRFLVEGGRYELYVRLSGNNTYIYSGTMDIDSSEELKCGPHWSLGQIARVRSLTEALKKDCEALGIPYMAFSVNLQYVPSMKLKEVFEDTSGFANFNKAAAEYRPR